MEKSTKRHQKEYDAWRGMIRRCYKSTNPRDRWHRDKGIQVCERWRNDFWQFLADIGEAPTPKHTLDRINSDGNYEPSNVRWATQKEQANNRSGIRTRMITHNGETMNAGDWARSLGLCAHTVARRIRVMGWSIEDAVTRPRNYRPPYRKPRAANLGKYAHKKQAA